MRWRVVLAGAIWALTAVAAQATASDLRPCHVPGGRHDVLCGQLSRPLDPTRPGGPHIEVHYVVAPAMARRKHPDPVFFLAGGPGQSASSLMPQVLPLLARLNDRRDIVFVDQRGTGRSAPLHCNEAPVPRLAELAEPARQFERLRACRQRLQALPALGGADGLKFFTTSIAVQDLDAVRRQLGAPRLNLIGGSYGTRAALEYQRQYPGAVRRSVLDGAAPPDMVLPASQSLDAQAALDALLSACAREADCRRRHPGLRAELTTLLAGLPRAVELPHPLSGEPERFMLTREMLLNAVRGALYSPASASALPQAIGQAVQGRWQGLMGLSSSFASRRDQVIATGMHFSVLCAEDAPRLGGVAPPHGGTDFGDTSAALYRRVCAEWPQGEVPAAFYTVPTSATPVMLLSGGLDPVTPPRHGERVARALGTRARHLVVDNAGHGVMALACMPDVLFRFIDAVDDQVAQAIDATCAKGIPRPPAFQTVALPLPTSTP